METAAALTLAFKRDDGTFILPDVCIATWVSAVHELERCADEVQAASRHEFAVGYLQALYECAAIDHPTYSQMREQILKIWLGPKVQMGHSSSHGAPDG